MNQKKTKWHPFCIREKTMEKSKIGLVLFNGKFEDGSLPFPSLTSTPYPLPISPQPPLSPPLSKTGKVPFFSLLCKRSESMRLHLASFIVPPKKKKVKSLSSKDRKENGILQKKILACKNPEEIETLLIQEGVLPSV